MTVLKVIEKWIARRARPDAVALAAVAGLRPAVVVIGGSAGIGLAIARRFARAGHDVVIVGRDVERLAQAQAAAAVAPHQRFETIALDISADGACRALDDALSAAGAYADIAVLSAGAGLSGPVLSHDPDAIEAIAQLNVTATTRLMRHLAAQMVARGRGGLITIASLGGLVPGPYQAVYYASKAFQISLSLALAEELSGRGVRIAVVAPGPVETEFHAAMGAEGALYRRLVPALTPEAVAASVYRGYGMGHGLIVPGVLNGLVARVSGFVPHRIMTRIVGTLLWPGPSGTKERQTPPNDGAP